MARFGEEGSLNLTNEMMVWATLLSESLVASNKSFLMKRSELGTPYKTAPARNLVTFEVFAKPSSFGSGRATVPGLNLFKRLIKRIRQWRHQGSFENVRAKYITVSYGFTK